MSPPPFFGMEKACPSLIKFHGAKLSTLSITYPCLCNWRICWEKNSTWNSGRKFCSCTTIPRLTELFQNRRNWLNRVPISWSPTLFTVPVLLELPPVDWTEKIENRHFSSEENFVASPASSLNGQDSDFFEWLGKGRAAVWEVYWA